MLDESLFDVPDALARADVHGLLHGAAESGARARTAIRLADDAGLAGLRPDGRPRAVLVAGYGPATSCVADLLGAFGNGGVPVTLLRPTGAQAAPAALSWPLPGWAGPLDLLLIATSGGEEPGLEALVEQAYRRGCTVVSVTPARTTLAEATGQTRGLTIPLAASPVPYEPPAAVQSGGSGTATAEQRTQPPVSAPGTLWALITPLLALCDRLGLLSAPPTALQALADRLDRTAERCGPAVETYSNPGKTLAAELAGALPLLWSEGQIAGAAARHCATTFASLAGRPALPAELPEAFDGHGALLTGAFGAAGDPGDFFRDRVEEAESLHTRIVLLREHAPTGSSAVVAARDLAYAHDIPLSELEPAEDSGPLEAAAELIATTDFAAVYLTLAAGDAS
ncbi:mannose-6-phosphate isomerase [Streptomyces armeniacus]|uniref:Mannose-6-phosphate isomerase n=1 Tax=Streptomyces armeniacus TaxID=83291 RepID=A0A345XQH3_9ACTN|nr:SIS domain-containing protein [Streptomyces armeniacus]AXK33889.1 mannose-6-phosphate isomerase [Streptomyces armeniacus]